MDDLILAGDIGGTKINLALFAAGQPAPAEPVREETFRTAQVDSFPGLLGRFVADALPRIAAACVGVAGPVIDGRTERINLSWTADRREMADLFGHDRVDVINDMVAMGYGIMALPPQSFAILQAGKPGACGNGALIAAGTGLGEALLIWNGRDWTPMPSEGGHATFSPNSHLELELMRYLMDRFERVSDERLLSGPGLFNIYRFLRDTGRAPEPASLAGQLTHEDPSAAISRLGLEGAHPLCEQALDLFVRIYGAEAGDLALETMATGGVWLGGGIAPKILPRLRGGPFLEAFRDKGRVSDLMSEIPVRVILDERAPLWGAAHRARRFLKR